MTKVTKTIEIPEEVSNILEMIGSPLGMSVEEFLAYKAVQFAEIEINRIEEDMFFDGDFDFDEE